MPHDAYRALYLHLPFCVKRCLYCDFETSALESSSVLIDEYIEQLCLDIRHKAKEGELAHIETIYVGGGTPSYVGMSRLSMLFYTLSLSLRLEPDVECSMEANPESLTERMVYDLWALGVNRLSLGVQSFDDEVLACLGRAHTADEARRAIDFAQRRFENISIDLMCGIPGQSRKSFESSIQEAIDLGVRHLSVYPLSIEENTPFKRMLERGELQIPDEDEAADAMEAAEALLRAAGFHRYEVANYAQEGFECRHNKAYWTGVPYLGLGRSAATMTQNATRRMRVQDGQVCDDLDKAQMIAEDLMLGMRLTQGVSWDLVEQAEKLIPQTSSVIAQLIQEGLAQKHDGRFLPTKKGWLLGNELFGALLDLAP